MDGWIETMGALLGGGGIGSVVTVLAGRMKTRAETAKVRAETQGEVTAHYEVLVGRLEKRIEVLEVRITDLEERLKRAYDCEAGEKCPVLGKGV